MSKKRLAIFMDGTWNVPSSDTNVSRLLKLVDTARDSDVQQLTSYIVGVGTTWTTRMRGAFGKGVNDRVRRAYLWLASNYIPGDEIFVFGFSRGAFEARSLVGFIDRCGLARQCTAAEVAFLFERYHRAELKSRGALVHTSREHLSKPDADFLDRSIAVQVQFLGIWDTVRYLDLPYGSIRGLSRSENLFHQIMSTDVCLRVRQAIAIDEHRRPYRNEPFEVSGRHSRHADIEQRWFIGDHCDVGGGHVGGVLSNVPLRWIQQQAALAGLRFTHEIVLRGDEHLQPLHDTYRRFLRGTFRLVRPRYYRPIGAALQGIDIEGVRQTVDETVFDRWQKKADYRPPNLHSWASNTLLSGQRGGYTF
jgi:uncharacterized protein (DUF2235 family)